MQTSVASCICNSSGRTIADLESVEEMMCSGCDRVSSDRMVDTRPEWRVFHSNNNNQSIGSPNTLSLQGRGLFAVIGNNSKDAARHKLDSSVKYVCLSNNENGSQKNITEPAAVTAATIRNRLKDWKDNILI